MFGVQVTWKCTEKFDCGAVTRGPRQRLVGCGRDTQACGSHAPLSPAPADLLCSTLLFHDLQHGCQWLIAPGTFLCIYFSCCNQILYWIYSQKCRFISKCISLCFCFVCVFFVLPLWHLDLSEFSHDVYSADLFVVVLKNNNNFNLLKSVTINRKYLRNVFFF